MIILPKHLNGQSELLVLHLVDTYSLLYKTKSRFQAERSGWSLIQTGRFDFRQVCLNFQQACLNFQQVSPNFQQVGK